MASNPGPPAPAFLHPLVEAKFTKAVYLSLFQAKDYKVAYSTCTKLMAPGYGPIWSECEKLSETSEFHDMKAK